MLYTFYMTSKEAEKFASRAWKIYFLILAGFNIVAIYAWATSVDLLGYLKGTPTPSLLIILPGIFSLFALCFVSSFNILSLLIYRIKRNPKGWKKFVYFTVLVLSGGYLVYFFYNLFT